MRKFLMLSVLVGLMAVNANAGVFRSSVKFTAHHANHCVVQPARKGTVVAAKATWKVLKTAAKIIY